jgi:pimeloyl-ACP methyl ester carboxylesterase
VATVFTTGDATSEMDALARLVQDDLELATADTPLAILGRLGHYSLFETSYDTPLWMSGDKPYGSEGGNFVYEGGEPVLQAWESTRLAVAVPNAEPPADGYPLMVYLDGTGSDYVSFARSAGSYEVASWATSRGAVALSFDMPLHGERATDNTLVELHSFNVLQPDSALHVHRQGAADVLYLVESLVDGSLVLTTSDGEELPLNRERIVVAGHSQGGIAMSLATPWLGERVRGVALSGTGGMLSITAVERQATVDFADLIRTGASFAEDEELTLLHPVMGLIQTLVDHTDPVVYAPYWFHEDRGLAGQASTSVLLMGGLADGYTPPRTAAALASAARLRFVSEKLGDTPGSDLRRLGVDAIPVRDNLSGWDGQVVTSGFSQWETGTHWVIWEEARARNTFRNFLSTAWEERAKITSKN